MVAVHRCRCIFLSVSWAHTATVTNEVRLVLHDAVLQLYPQAESVSACMRVGRKQGRDWFCPWGLNIYLSVAPKFPTARSARGTETRTRLVVPMGTEYLCECSPQSSHRQIRTRLPVGIVHGLALLPWPAFGTNRVFQAWLFNRLPYPIIPAVRLPSLDAHAQPAWFFRCQWCVNASRPVRRPVHRPRRQQGFDRLLAIDPRPQAPATPHLRSLDQSHRQGIPLDAGQERQQVVVTLYREALETLLPDVARGAIPLVVSPRMGDG